VTYRLQSHSGSNPADDSSRPRPARLDAPLYYSYIVLRPVVNYVSRPRLHRQIKEQLHDISPGSSHRPGLPNALHMYVERDAGRHWGKDILFKDCVETASKHGRQNITQIFDGIYPTRGQTLMECRYGQS